MKRIVLVALLSACWRSSPPPAQPAVENQSIPTPVRATAQQKTEFDVMLDRLQEFADRFCDCSDAQCAEQVSDDMTRWSQETFPRGPSESPKMSDEQTRQVAELAERMGQCLQNAMSGSPTIP